MIDQNILRLRQTQFIQTASLKIGGKTNTMHDSRSVPVETSSRTEHRRIRTGRSRICRRSRVSANR